MKILKSTLFIIASAIVCYLCWLIFYFLTPLVYQLNWLWLIIVLILGGGILIPTIGMLPGMISFLFIKLKSNNIIESVIVTIIILFFTFSSIRLAWIVDSYESSFKYIFTAIFQNIIVLGVYWGMFLSLVTTQKEDLN